LGLEGGDAGHFDAEGGAGFAEVGEEADELFVFVSLVWHGV